MGLCENRVPLNLLSSLFGHPSSIVSVLCELHIYIYIHDYPIINIINKHHYIPSHIPFILPKNGCFHTARIPIFA